jgi:hypothetical protein
LGDKPSINGGLLYLKYCIKIEKTTINVLSSTQKEYIYVKSGCHVKLSLVIEFSVQLGGLLSYISGDRHLSTGHSLHFVTGQSDKMAFYPPRSIQLNIYNQ